jgi:hypothetical protein
MNRGIGCMRVCRAMTVVCTGGWFLRCIVLLMIASGLSGCGASGSSATPSAPSPAPLPAPPAPPSSGSWLAGYTLTGVSLSGVVYESTPAGWAPIAGALVYCELCGELTHTWATADASGVYSFSGDLAHGGGVWLSSGIRTPVSVQANGYQDPPGLAGSYGQRYVLINGDTRFDMEMVRR